MDYNLYYERNLSYFCKKYGIKLEGNDVPTTIMGFKSAIKTSYLSDQVKRRVIGEIDRDLANRPKDYFIHEKSKEKIEYLTTSDIESFGFKLDGFGWGTVFRAKGEFHPVYGVAAFDELEIHYAMGRNEMIIYSIKNSPYYEKQRIFAGLVRSKREFNTVLKLCNLLKELNYD